MLNTNSSYRIITFSKQLAVVEFYVPPNRQSQAHAKVHYANEHIQREENVKNNYFSWGICVNSV